MRMSHSLLLQLKTEEDIMTTKKVKKYDPNASYKIGEIIEHPIFKEKGEIIAIGMTTDGIKKMTVKFEKSGEKRLIMSKK